MPIIVHRGADHHSRKKKQLLHQSSSEELLGDKKKPSVVNEKEDLGQQIAKDLAEILDFRVYRVKDTTTFLDREKKTETVLIGGDQFYSKEESSQELKKLNNQDASATTRTDAVAEKANGKETQLYGTVQNLVASSKRIDSNANKAEFLAKIRNSSHRLNLIKSGHKMLDLLEEPDVDSTIDWAFDYVQHYQSALIPSLLELCQHLKYFDSKKKDRLVCVFMSRI